MQQEYSFKVDKLVRDKIPDIIEQKGIKVAAKFLTEQQYAIALQGKLIEEAGELNEAENQNDVLQELGDLLEVMLAIAKFHSFSLEDITAQMKKKRAQLGGFDAKVYLDFIQVNRSNAHYEYYKKRPFKYPEINNNI